MAKRQREATGTHFGHPTYQNTASGQADDYRFCDTDEPLWPDAYFERECPACGMRPTPEGHDPCLGRLPGVRNACCGHGTGEGYIQFKNGAVVRGEFSRITREAGGAAVYPWRKGSGSDG